MFNWEIFFIILGCSVAGVTIFLLALLAGMLFAEDKFGWGSLVVATGILEVAIIVGFIA